MEIERAVAVAGTAMEVAGVGAIVVGALVAVVVAASALRREGPAEAFDRLRQTLGRAILLGLELLVAADIIRTVSSSPTLEGVLVLALIVVIRTSLSFALQVELEGRWPWQRGVGAKVERP